jgi:hypothetical protein
MEQYSGFEPQVGEIRAVRTFRIGSDGLLYPLFRDVAWQPGPNTARCTMLDVGAFMLHPLQSSVAHQVPEPDCSCGYYAYATESATLEYPNARHVLAVVACWGHVIAGTRGLRAENARVEALWLSSAVPGELAALVAERYPDVTAYSEKQAMLATHPPTALDCYELDDERFDPSRWVVRLVAASALALGLVPAAWLASNLDVRVAWLVELAVLLLATLHFWRGRSITSKRRSMQSVALLLWLLSPLGGVSGTVLLRIPIIQITALFVAQRRGQIREANRFPARIASLESGDRRRPLW